MVLCFVYQSKIQETNVQIILYSYYRVLRGCGIWLVRRDFSDHMSSTFSQKKLFTSAFHSLPVGPLIGHKSEASLHLTLHTRQTHLLADPQSVSDTISALVLTCPTANSLLMYAFTRIHNTHSGIVWLLVKKKKPTAELIWSDSWHLPKCYFSLRYFCSTILKGLHCSKSELWNVYLLCFFGWQKRLSTPCQRII